MSLGENKISIVADIIIWYLRFFVFSVILNVVEISHFSTSIVAPNFSTSIVAFKRDLS